MNAPSPFPIVETRTPYRFKLSVHREPQGEVYGSVTALEADQRITPPGLPDVSFALCDPPSWA